jgi:hypothetical protein
VYRLGNWEYSYLYRDAPASTTYSALKYGAWVLELKGHLQAIVSGGTKVGLKFQWGTAIMIHEFRCDQVRYFHNVRINTSYSDLMLIFTVTRLLMMVRYPLCSDFCRSIRWFGLACKSAFSCEGIQSTTSAQGIRGRLRALRRHVGLFCPSSLGWPTDENLDSSRCA